MTKNSKSQFYVIFFIILTQFFLTTGMGSILFPSLFFTNKSLATSSQLDQQIDSYIEHFAALTEVKFMYDQEILNIPKKDIALTVDFEAARTELSAGNEVSKGIFSFNEEHLRSLLQVWGESFRMEPVNARLEQKSEQIEIQPEVEGIELNLDATLERFYDHLVQLDLYDPIPVVMSTVQPAISTNMLQNLNHLLGTAYTEYNSINLDRTANVKLATERLNGVLLEPGETFSFVEHTGPYTEEEGYKLATIIQDYGFEEGPGGGVCQVSSTLYLAALYSELEVIERHHHQRPVTYIQPGLDATVNNEQLDLKLFNPYSFPLYIQAEAVEGELMVQIYGADTTPSSLVTILANKPTKVPFEVVFQESSSIPLGEPQIEKKGEQGIRVKVYEVKMVDNQEQQSLISEDTYLPKAEVILHHPDENLAELKKKYSQPGELG